ERTIEMVAGVIAVLKAGGAYLPLEATYPVKRLELMIRDSALSVILTHRALTDGLCVNGAKVVCLDDDRSVIDDYGSEALENWVNSDNLTYVMYTSGSTGIPKGIGLPHRALANLTKWRSSSAGRGARTLQYASLSFDVSFYEIFSALSTGGTVILIS